MGQGIKNPTLRDAVELLQRRAENCTETLARLEELPGIAKGNEEFFAEMKRTQRVISNVLPALEFLDQQFEDLFNLSKNLKPHTP